MNFRWDPALVICSCLVEMAFSANFLVFQPIPWKSHHLVYHSVIKELASRGHQIDYLTAVPIENPPPNVKHLPIKNFLMEQLRRTHPEDLDQLWPPVLHRTFRNTIIASLRYAYLKEPSIQELLHSNRTYDVVLSEYHMYQEINAVWVHKFKALAVSLMVFGEFAFANELYGLPDNPSYMVDFSSPFTSKMDFFERFGNAVSHILSTGVHYFKLLEIQELADEVLRYPGWEDRPKIWNLASDMALVLVNTHHAVGHSTPKAPHVKEIGGLTLAGSTSLPEDVKYFMDEAAEGVVYFSLGTNVDLRRLMRGEHLERIMKFFGKLKYKVILKWAGGDSHTANSPNVLIGNWFPQLGVLAHPNIKLFITHGGLQSAFETVNFGVPIVGVPVYADQHKNVNFLVSVGCGVKIDKRNLTAESLEWAINEVIDNPRYKSAMLERSAILRDSPKPLDEAIYWIEYVLKHGKALQPASVHLPFYQIYLLDVATFCIATVIIVASLCLTIVKVLYNLIIRKVEPRQTVLGKKYKSSGDPNAKRNLFRKS